MPFTSAKLSVSDYALAVSTANPTPGGGSVAGVTGSLAAGLLGMVCAVTLRGKTTDEQRAKLEPAELSAGELRGDLLKLAARDETAYSAYRSAAAMSKTTEEERAARFAALQVALAEAAEAPLAIARNCFALLAMLPTVAAHGSKHVLSDASAGAILADAALRAALLNVRVNAASMRDAELSDRLTGESALLEFDSARLVAETLNAVAAR